LFACPSYFSGAKNEVRGCCGENRSGHGKTARSDGFEIDRGDLRSDFILVNDSRSIPSSAREKLVSKLPVTGELLRGSLLERTVRHNQRLPEMRAWRRAPGCFVLTVTYAGGRTRQLSVRRERVGRGFAAGLSKLSES